MGGKTSGLPPLGTNLTVLSNALPRQRPILLYFGPLHQVAIAHHKRLVAHKVSK